MPVLRQNEGNSTQPFSFTPSVWRLIEIYVAELVGTAMLLYFGCMSSLSWNGLPNHPWQGAIVFSVVVATVIQVFGHISSAHLNPAITVNFLLLGHITKQQAVVYCLAECGGAILGFGALKWLTPCDIMNVSMALSNNSLCQTLPNPAVSDTHSIVLEFLATGCLVLVNCACADSRNAKNGAANSLKFAATILALSLSVGPYTGASMNPARTLGPAFWNKNYNKIWIYWFAPILSAIVVTIFYQTMFDRKPEAESMLENVPLKEVKAKEETNS